MNNYKRLISIALTAVMSVSIIFSSTDSVLNKPASIVAEKDSTVSEKQVEVIEEKSGYYAYDLSNHRTYGATVTGTMDFEGVMGMTIDTNGKTVTVSTYTNKPEVNKFTGKIKVSEPDSFTDVMTTYTDLKIVNDKITFTPSETGIYRLGMDLGESYCYAYVYFDGSKAYACRYSSSDISNTAEIWKNLMADADPKDYLSNKDITYPTSGQFSRPVHVTEWENKSDEILKNFKDSSDELKAYILTAYIAKHYAYDRYRTNTLKMKSRADEAGAYKDEYYMYYNNVGVCWDFVNALVIMLRHQGIPATSVENYGHTSVAVYLQDEWLCIDPTQLVRQECASKDINPDNWRKCSYL